MKIYTESVAMPPTGDIASTPSPPAVRSPPSSTASSSTYKRRRTNIDKFLSKHLTGKTNGVDFSESWREKFSHHPSWCDADMCLQQIEAGNAHGNRVALYSRAFFQRILYRLGDGVQRWPKLVILVATVLLSVCLIGLKDVQIETDLVKLWVEQGGRLDEELAFFDEVRARYKARKSQSPDSTLRRKRNDISVKTSNMTNTVQMPIKPQQVARRPPLVEIPSDTGLSGGFQVIIQTPEEDGANVLTRDPLLRHVHILEEIARYDVEMFGETWSLADICFKPPAPKIPKNNILAGYQHIFDKLIPCIWITPADCFWEASKALGPYPSISLDGVNAILPHLPNGNLSWRTLDPALLLSDLGDLKELIGNVNEILESLFNRAGVGHAYQNRPCIEPLDHECPKSAPNYFDQCAAFRKFLQWNNKRPEGERVRLTTEELPKPAGPLPDIDFSRLIGRRKRETNVRGNKSATSDDYYDDSHVDDVKTTTVSPAMAMAKQFSETCTRYSKSFLSWMRAVGPQNWQFLNERVIIDGKEIEVAPPVYPHYGEELTNGCEGFGRNIMKWPEDLIIGGVRRENGIITHAEAFQSIFLVAGAGDVYQRFKEKDPHMKPNLDTSTFSINHAGAIIAKWQRAFTERLYAHPLNDNAGRARMLVETQRRVMNEFGAGLTRTETVQGVTVNFSHEGELVGGVEGEEQVRVIHPLASTSIQDMLKEFSKFQFGVIFMGYLLMVLYAGFTQFDWDGWWFSTRSNCFLAVIGVFIITYASVAGLGLSAVMGIHFNAATTQIVPFLTLGLGIDDMFLFLHNYAGVLESVRRREVAILVKETGMSIFITSSNNILAFVAGTILPIPALRSFCAQTSILLFFNLISIVIVFPAFITLDLRRRKLGIRDMTCGCCRTGSSSSASIFDVAGVRSANSSRNKLAKEPSVDSMAAMEEMAVAYGQPLAYGMNAFPLAATGSSAEAAHARKQHEAQMSSSRHCHEPLYTLEGFLHRFYIPALMKPSVKFMVILISAAMFTFGCIGLRDNVLGLELADVLPENTPPAAFLRAREKYFSFYPIFIVLKEDIDYPRQQDTIEQLRLDIGKSSFVIKGDTILRHVQEPSEHYWIWYMRQYLLSLQSRLDASIKAGQIDVETGAIKKRLIHDEAIIGRRLLCSQGNQFNCTNRMNRRLVDDNGVIIRDSFYNCLTAWYTMDNMMYYVSQGQIFPPPPTWGYNSTEDGLIPPADNISYSQIPFYMTGLTDTPVIVKMIEEIRAICERYSIAMNLPVFPSGIPFTFWEQYLSLTSYLFAAILIIGVTVLVIISVIIFNPWAAAMVAMVVVSMTVELGGFMGLFGVKMNPISAVTLITAVGIGVEFTAHVVLAFLTSLGNRDERMVACLDHMFVPVVHGVLSTLLGIIMLAFSEFDFVVKYFFVVMTVLILIGMFNGLAMLPVMLSLIGPPCEVHPADNGKRLPVPCFYPSKNEKKFTSERSENCSVSFDAASKKISPPPTFEADDKGTSYVYHGSLSTVAEEDPNRLSAKTTTGRTGTSSPQRNRSSSMPSSNSSDQQSYVHM